MQPNSVRNEFAQQFKEAFAPDRLGLMSNFRTTFCDGIAWLLNFHSKIKH